MTQTLSNGVLDIAVASHGAELQSLRHAGREYLWQGDARYWARRSPVLFPMVGRVWGNEFRVDGRTYPMGQHGFARDTEFTPVADAPEGTLLYELRSSDATRALFPFDFALRIGYRLEGASLVVSWEVRNTGSRTLPFQIGAHPAFYVPGFDADAPVRCYFGFDTEAPLTHTVPEGGGTGRTPHTLERDAQGMMAVDARTFDCDTYVFAGSQLRRIDLLDSGRRPHLSVEFDAPIVALWSPTATKPDCPFVCIEPWYGAADPAGYSGEFADRENMNLLAPGHTFSASYRITIH